MAGSEEAGLRLIAYPILGVLLLAVTIVGFLWSSVLISVWAMIVWLSVGPFLAGETVRWIGRLLVRGFLRQRTDPLLRLPFVIHFVVSWWSGFLFIYIAALVLWGLGYFAVEALVIIFAAASGLAPLLYLKRIVRHLPARISPALKQLREKAVWLVVIIASSATMFILLRAFSPPPFQIGWDSFTHSFISDQIRINSVFFPLPQPFSNSILINPYTTMFYVLTSVISYLGNGDILLLFWIGPLFNFGVFAVGLAFLSKKAGFPVWIALGVVVVGLSYHEWNKGASLVYFSPSALITAFAPLILGIQLAYRRINRIWSFHFASAGIILVHFFAGALLVVVGYTIPIIRRLSRGRVIDYRIVFAAIMALSSLIILSLTLGWAFYESLLGPITEGRVSDVIFFTRVSFAWKLETLFRLWYTAPLVVSAVAGVLILATQGVFNKGVDRRVRSIAIIGFVMLAVLAVFLIRIDQTSRFLFLARPGIFLLAGFFVMEVSRGLGKRRSSVLAVLLIALIAASAAHPYSLFMNRQRWAGDTEGLATSFVYYEREMGMWIRENLPQAILVISDPETQRMIEGLALRMTLFGKDLPEEDEAILKQVFQAQTPEDASRTFRTLIDSRGYDPDLSYLLVSGRTLFWAHNDIRHVYQPRALNEPGLLQVFAEPSFELVHVVDMQIYLYLVHE